LGLLVVKRQCMLYIAAHFSSCVSAANRQVVEILGNSPELLSEVVGMSSPDFAKQIISSLPDHIANSSTTTTTLERDMMSLFESEELADVRFKCCNTEEDEAFFLCHRVVLTARCPLFSSSFQALHALKEDGDQALVTQEDRNRVALVFDPQTDAEGRVVVREVNQSSSLALKCFLIFLYTDQLAVKPDVAFDVLQMTYVYGMGTSSLARECEQVLRQNISPSNALDTLCIAQQLGVTLLLEFCLEYIVRNLVECVEANEGEDLNECVFDFPQLGVALLRAVGSRIRENKAQSALVKREQ
jgi:hypothetical protein